ncbi:hypothetical protein M2138_001889, partial [Dysgonomonadaceae bacterium PH5-43]|nr:hypothetical protein [Dysgonomonadaceae bacterium PH5-43]
AGHPNKQILNQIDAENQQLSVCENFCAENRKDFWRIIILFINYSSYFWCVF